MGYKKAREVLLGKLRWVKVEGDKVREDELYSLYYSQLSQALKIAIKLLEASVRKESK